MANEQVIQLQGRIIALELMVRGLLTDFACKDSRPHLTAERLKSNFLSSLQNTTRQIGDYEDAVWESAADAMRLTLDQVIQRVSYYQKEGSIPPDAE